MSIPKQGNRGAYLWEEGIPQELVSTELNERLSEDLLFESGHILGSMCSKPDPFASRIFTQQLEKNIGDPGLHPALAEMERETVAILGEMLGSAEASGTLLSGGTEANILALWTAKIGAESRRGEDFRGGKRPAVVLPESAHFSFDKAASLMDLELRKVSVDRDHRFSLEDVEAAIDDSVVALVGIAGTTGLGIVDPIEELAKIALDHELYFHVDAAFGGFVLPFLEEAGYPSRRFDFRIPGVSSVTLDPHKMGRAPIPSGCILYRDESIAGLSRTDVGYLAGGKTSQQTIIGTRSGAAVAAVWAALRRYGRRGFIDTVRGCMELSRYLAAKIEKSEHTELMTEPFMNVVGFLPAGEGLSAEALAEELRRRGYAVSLFPGFIRITLMPHVKKAALDRFWKEVEDVLS